MAVILKAQRAPTDKCTPKTGPLQAGFFIISRFRISALKIDEIDKLQARYSLARQNDYKLCVKRITVLNKSQKYLRVMILWLFL
ncbi:MAG: hypothetical protein EA408_09715 [Marinilabiliales bacterium]|nr:MAG: hypothetical protein EA408_09715 [Marinilabiliales bacterium]